MRVVYYSPSEITFDYKTCLWLLDNLMTLRSGSWPSEHLDDASVPNQQMNQKAPFATPIEYAAELTARLEKCGEDGLKLLAIEGYKESTESVAKYFGKPEWSTLKGAKTAMRYISSGHTRRWLDNRKRVGVSYKEFKKRRLT